LDDVSLGVALPLEASFLEHMLHCGGEKMERCTSTSSTTVSFGDMVHQDLGVGRDLMDSRGTEALSSLVVVSMAGLVRATDLVLKWAQRRR
jgi:hypothetical protein